jgi:hypothetical protein
MKSNKVLGGILVVQLILSGFMWSTKSTKKFEQRALFDVKLEDINEFTIRRPKGDKHDENDSITVIKKDGKWLLPDYDNYVLAVGKVEDILGRLTMAKIRRAVAKKKENHNALSVGERDFTKHISVKTKERAYSLYVGNAKGSSMHARFDGQDEVYLARGVAAWKVSHELRNYVDTDYINQDDITELNIRNQSGQIDARQNEDGTWVIAQLPSDKPIDIGRVRSVVNAAKQVKLATPVSRTDKPEYGLGKLSRGTVHLKNATGSVKYEIGAQAGEFVYVKASNQEFIVKVRKFNVSAVLQIKAEEFIDNTKLQEASPPNGFPLDPKDWPKDPPAMP